MPDSGAAASSSNTVSNLSLEQRGTIFCERAEQRRGRNAESVLVAYQARRGHNDRMHNVPTIVDEPERKRARSADSRPHVGDTTMTVEAQQAPANLWPTPVAFQQAIPPGLGEDPIAKAKRLLGTIKQTPASANLDNFRVPFITIDAASTTSLDAQYTPPKLPQALRKVIDGFRDDFGKKIAELDSMTSILQKDISMYDAGKVPAPLKETTKHQFKASVAETFGAQQTLANFNKSREDLKRKIEANAQALESLAVQIHIPQYLSTCLQRLWDTIGELSPLEQSNNVFLNQVKGFVLNVLYPKLQAIKQQHEAKASKSADAKRSKQEDQDKKEQAAIQYLAEHPAAALTCIIRDVETRLLKLSLAANS